MSTLLFTSVNSFSQSKNWNEIDSVFITFDLSNIQNLKCQFQFKNLEKGFAPDVDVFDASHKTLLSEITKDETIKLVKYYAEYCRNCKGMHNDKESFINEIQNFLKFNTYTIQLNYRQINYKTVGLICLIYNSNNQYLLYWFEDKEYKTSH